MTVSVIIPTHNRSDALARALRSVAAQTCRDFEVIVVDDASTDDTPAVAHGLESLFAAGALKYVRCERQRGGAAARNAGVRAARGDLIALLDADDEWRPTKLEKQLARFAQLPSAVGLLTTQYLLVDAAGTVTAENPPRPREGNLSASLAEAIDRRDEIVGVFSTLMARREVFDAVGGLDEQLVCWHDTDFYLRAAERFEFAFLPETLTIKHERADSISGTWPVQARGSHRFWQKHRRRFSHRFRRYVGRHQRGLGMRACLEGNLKEGRRLFRRSQSIWPLQASPLLHLAVSCAGARAYAGAVSTARRLRRAHLGATLVGSISRRLPCRRWQAAFWLGKVLSPRRPFVGAFRGGLMEVHPGDVASTQAFYVGFFEREVTMLCLEEMRRNPPELIVDVGANFGYYPLLFGLARRGATRAIAFEPDPVNLLRLRRNVALNPGLAVTIVPMAVGDRDDEAVDFDSAPDGHHVWSRMAEVRGGDDHGWRRTRVPMTSLDTYLDRQGIARVPLTLIDVEGYEGKTVDGMRRGLAAHRYEKIMVEFHPWAFPSWQEVQRIAQTIVDAGYRGFRIRHHGAAQPDKAAAYYRMDVLEPVLEPMTFDRLSPWEHFWFEVA
jgi:FkbM family methyltransferase